MYPAINIDRDELYSETDTAINDRTGETGLLDLSL
jgi:hypothetical protein